MSGNSSDSTATVIENVRAHADAIVTKFRDITETHLPEVLNFLETLDRNPLVTAFAGSIPGPISGDAMAILNGLVPLLGAMGGKVVQVPEAPAPAAAPAEVPALAVSAVPAPTYTA